MWPVFARANSPYNLLWAVILCVAIIGYANVLSAQVQDPLRQGSRWKGEILQGNQTFPTTIYISNRSGERIKGEIDFTTSSGLSKLTFQGNIIDRNTVAWITDKKEGNVTYPGLYVGKISGNQISGIWQVPSAGQYDRFTVTLAE